LGWRVQPVVLNGCVRLLFHSQGQVRRAIAFEFDRGQITAVYNIANPEKLRHLTLH